MIRSVCGVCEDGKCVHLPQDVVTLPGHAETAVKAEGQYRTPRDCRRLKKEPAS